MLLEYIFGLRPDVPRARVVLDVRLTERYGVRRYPFGADGLLDVEVAARRSASDEPAVTVRGNLPLTVDLRWPGGRREFAATVEG